MVCICRANHERQNAVFLGPGPYLGTGRSGRRLEPRIFWYGMLLSTDLESLGSCFACCEALEVGLACGLRYHRK